MKRAKKVHNPFAISAKRLAELNTPHSCPRCFYIRNLMHGSHRDAPYSVNPAGLLTRLDSLEKKLVASVRPDFLKAYDDYEFVKTHRMEWTDPKTGIELTGVPDLVFLKNGKLVVLDLKSSKPKDTPASGDKAAFLKIVAIYGAQLHVYKTLLEAEGLGEVVQMGILYFWPDEEVSPAENGINVRFKASEIPVVIDGNLVDRLLLRARAILLTKKMPPYRRDCVDCIRTAGFLKIFGVETSESRQVLTNIKVEVP